jgi:hypothetical protein
MSGWIKINRSIQDHWLNEDRRIFSRLEAWYDILLTVNYSEAKIVIKGKLYTVKRGESILSLDSWAKRWNWDRSKVRRFLKLLQTDFMLVLKTDTITTHLTVCNFALYQDIRNADETHLKRKRNADEKQTTTIEEEEEEQQEQQEKEEDARNLDSLDKLHVTPKEKACNFLPPGIEEVIVFFDEKGYSEESAKKAFYYYESANWKDRNNMQVKNWKQKMIGVWFKDENLKTNKPKTYVLDPLNVW